MVGSRLRETFGIGFPGSHSLWGTVQRFFSFGLDAGNDFNGCGGFASGSGLDIVVSFVPSPSSFRRSLSSSFKWLSDLDCPGINFLGGGCPLGTLIDLAILWSVTQESLLKLDI
jgi:hypothetical protein